MDEKTNKGEAKLETQVSQENARLLEECCKAFGWNGGTIPQVIAEIKRIKNFGCKGCKYNVAETDIWHSDKCPDCARSERKDLYESRSPVRRDFIWTISRYTLDWKQDGEYTIVKKIPIGEAQETEVEEWNKDCTLQDAQDFIDKSYPGHLVLAVRENKISA